MKRKLQQANAYELRGWKKSKPLPENEDRLSKLPPEILLEILKKLEPGKGSIVAFSQTSKLFHGLCLPRLALRLDFNRIKADGAYPVMQRAYEEVVVTGAEIDERVDKIKKVLRSSRCSATKLYIGADDSEECRMALRALLAILTQLPNITELDMENVNAMQPITSFTAIKTKEYPVLGSLKQLHFHNCGGDTLSALERLSTLEKLQMCVTVLILEVSAFVARQRGLQSFQTNCTHGLDLDHGTLPNLKSFQSPNGVCRHSSLPEDIFKIAPNVEHITLISSALGFFFITEDSFLLYNESVHLKTIKTDAFIDLEEVSIEDIRRNYPNLQSFKSANMEWRRVVA